MQKQDSLSQVKSVNKLVIRGAREHNLQNIDVELPRDKLVVISGLSGSGKSSLAFDTIFAEGQRRYVESLSAYARQFLGRMDKPDVDYIGGLSPAISIEQKTTHRNPRSTVGTVTEIYDYYRLLYARIGHAHCPNCGKEIQEQTVDQIIDTIMTWNEGTRIQLLSPIIKGKKGEHQKIIEDAQKAGFVRARIDGLIVNLEDGIKLDKQKKHTIELIVDRIQLSKDVRKRLAESVETALESSGGTLIVLTQASKDSLQNEVFFSQKNACPDCGISMPELQPRLFSFNNPFGACPECTGLGAKQAFDFNLLVPDKTLSFNEGAFLTFKPDSAWNYARFAALAEKYGFSLDTPVNKLSKKALSVIMYGTGSEPIHFTYEREDGSRKASYNRPWLGVFSEMQRKYNEAYSNAQRESYERYMSVSQCEACKGRRLKPEALAVTVGGKNIYELTLLSVSDSIEFFKNLKISETEQVIAQQILKEITSRLDFMQNVGLDYLTLERKAATLSGGEAQRIRLATQIGSSLIGVLYILDEPSIGLHQRDNERLINTLTYLRDIGNTVLVVEHDEQTLRTADYIVDLGPGAGVHGGKIIAAGTPAEVMRVKESLTGQYLAGTLTMEVPKERRKGNGHVLRLSGVTEHNLKNVSVDIPLGTFTCITGVSGSGKSTLLTDILYPAVSNRLMRSSLPEGAYKKIEGLEHIDKVINIDQSPIGRTPRSNPATYVGVFTGIRDLFASLPDSKMRGYKPGRFSFNVRGGRCEHCRGDGTITIEMNFLPDVYITCDVCRGKRFNKETLDIRYKGKNIADVLNLTVEEAADFFAPIPHIARKLETLLSVGLGYIKLGQSALTLSGGEAQRVKLANELAKRSTGKTLYILDEPTTGLHFADVKQLMAVIQRLVEQGNTVVMIEHNLDVILQADKLIDLGPEGGVNGGEIIAEGTPEELAAVKNSYTGFYVKEMLERNIHE
ncbi:excinuclease ABC subunit UvrA [Treponema phagedenis]|uniref:UvrABC system protein A n=1 Tax=Treponema phagedenis TaxID=162 RepID=A0A0B7GW84_TREPH|nr:excinuclease ABC subunit UvrA [Treponema phagedenis]NVP23861.1 excinuclease ABC subunit UvrA [Treponema phagedenis]QEJ99513.1 excinuclease ABC subunit UvrA [Treponema phagedenis]QEK05084.1 excinuclease ABC subunit UvrA [Treponema phagedenis]QEK10706.1 excinuclease ABC subunit UvrA [Treponema phagedenis]QLC59403.1 excinuclease ABC subunit UvrA [Treponema phagedenis]